MPSIELLKFAKTLAGHFSNFDQSQDNPKEFAHINVYFIPLDIRINGKPGFYSEQSYDHDPWRPYRQGFHCLEEQNGIFIIQNFGYPHHQRVAGSGGHPSLLKQIKPELLTSRCGCSMHFRSSNNGNYVGSVEPGKQCLVPRDGKITYLVSEVDLGPLHWHSRDRGFDPSTDEQCWGSEHGMLKFKRVASLGENLDMRWLKD